jgi:heme exporter protein A
MVGGFLAPVSGAIRLNENGKDITDAEERGRRIGWFGHQDALKGPLTVAEQLVFFARLYGRPLRRPGTSPTKAGEGNIETVLEQVGLTRQRELPCRYLSAGQRRRLALARLVVSARPLWLLDEPFAALDTAGKGLLAGLMARHCGQGGMVLAATHEPLGLSDRSIEL